MRARREGRLGVTASPQQHGAMGGYPVEQRSVADCTLGDPARDEAPQVVVVSGGAGLRRGRALAVRLVVEQATFSPEGSFRCDGVHGKPGTWHSIVEGVRDLRRGGGPVSERTPGSIFTTGRTYAAAPMAGG